MNDETKDLMGNQVQDRITGFVGIATSKHIYLTGCNQYGVQAPVNDKNEIPEVKYFDEGRLIWIGLGITANEVIGEKPGCDNREHP